MKTDKLDGLRQRIGQLNRRILDDLNERLRLVDEIRAVKLERGLAFHDPKREKAMLRELAAANEGPLTEAQLRRIYGAIFEAALEYLEAGAKKKGKREKTKTAR
ncbi:MAG TPA: chorismate mutase [Myxococcales bacterium]